MRVLMMVALVLWPLAASAERVLSVGGSVTEIIYALGAQDRLVGRDSTSTYPAQARELPDVGYMRALSPEGVLSVAPDLILSEAGAGPVETIEVLKSAGVRFVEIPDGYDGAAALAKIAAVGAALGVDSTALSAQVEADIKAAADGKADSGKRVMFILSLRGGRVMASGANTAADGIIRMAGGVNAVAGFDGYKPLTDEAVAAAAPDVILMMDRRGEHSVSDDDLWTMPALATTPAAQRKSIVRMDGLLMLGFGPRTGQAVTALREALGGA